MLENMEDCFLNTYIWEGIHRRMQKVTPERVEITVSKNLVRNEVATNNR